MLRSTFVTSSLLLLGLGLAGVRSGAAASGPDGLVHGRQILVELTGVANGIEVGGPGSGVLDFDTLLVDPTSGRYLGTGTDRLLLTTIEGGDPFAGESFVMTNQTTFDLPGGTITTQNRTTVAPFVQGSTGPFETAVTHSTSDFSRGVILSGTGRYAGISGSVKLAGAVDMSQFTGGPGSPIGFNCLFTFELD